MVASFIFSDFNFTDYLFYRLLQCPCSVLKSTGVADFHVMCPVFFYRKLFLRARLKNRNVSDVILKIYVMKVIVS